MALKIVKASEPMLIDNLITFIYGDPGIGKTSLAYSAKNPVLFDFDCGAHRAGKFRKDTVPVKKWSDVCNLNADYFDGYDTIIVDTAGRMLDVIIADLVRDQKNCRKNSNELSIQGYGTLNKRFTSWLNLLRSFGNDVILLAHSAEDKKGDDIIIRPDMVGGSKKEAYKVADMMGYMTSAQGEQSTLKAIHFSPNVAYHAKDSGAIGNMILPDLTKEPDALANILQRAKDHINNLSETQAEAQKELNDWRAECMAASNADDLNSMAVKLPRDHIYTREMWDAALDMAKSLNLQFDKATKSFVAIAVQS